MTKCKSLIRSLFTNFIDNSVEYILENSNDPKDIELALNVMKIRAEDAWNDVKDSLQNLKDIYD